MARSDCEPLGGTASHCEATESCREKPASSWETTASSCAGAGSGAPLRPLQGSLQALLSPKDCLSLAPHGAESTVFRSA